MNPFANLPFSPADILLPKDCDLTKWSVVACDQYTSQPEYWQGVENFVGRAPSALRLILPESCLEGPDVETDILAVNEQMTRYLREGKFSTYSNALFYVERRLENGKIRRGIVGKVDLEEYDYEPGAAARIRATEGTVLARIPPRVAVRKNAPIELPHAMLLTDDPGCTVIEPLAAQKEQMEQVYDFPLMEESGHLTGWKLTEPQQNAVAAALLKLAEPDGVRVRYGTDAPPLLFAVGDGNHSLATAKECYQRQKKLAPPDKWNTLPSRYALVELVNLHDQALEFQPIHRVLFQVEPEEVLAALLAAYPGAHMGPGAGHNLPFVHRNGSGVLTVPNPVCQLPVGTLQAFLDDYSLGRHYRIDYIHGGDVAANLAAKPGNLGFLLPAMDKNQLFPAVLNDGVLPRKTFSMGNACDKRFYLEARKIR